MRPCDSLTPRERECAELIAQGYSTKDVAALMGVTPQAVRNLLYHACEKTGMSNRVELSYWISHAPARVAFEPQKAHTLAERRDIA